MIRAIIFDCFGVLYVDASHAFYEEKVQNYEQLRPRLQELNAQSDYGLITQEEWHEQVAQITNLTVDDVHHGIQNEHKRNRTLLEYIGQLRAKGILVGMLSNIGTGAMEQFFSSKERSELFDAVVLSGEEMVTKPSPVIFELMAQRLGIKPSECLMIDDVEENCAGADAAGMRAIRFETTAQTVHQVKQLLEQPYA